MKTVKLVLLVLLVLLVFWLVTLPAVVLAQFAFVTNNGAIIITGYSGSGAAVIPNTTNGYPVTSINYGAFSFNAGLTGITIPNNITNIGGRAFYYCTGLAKINVDDGNPAYSSTNGVLFNHNLTTLVDFPAGLGGSYLVPNSVTNIGVEAFYWCAIVTNVLIPNSVVSIGSSAFGNCLALTGVTIPNSVTSIGDSAFAVCTNLKSIIIPNSITNIGTSVFGGSGLTNIIIPDSVINIGDSAFCPCYSLKSITIPSSVLSIQEFAFQSCSNLKYVFFKGNAPTTNANLVFPGDTAATAYYLPGTTGWGTNYSGIPTALWNPQAQVNNRLTGGQNDPFSFNITGTTNIPVVVEASTDLGSNWTALQSINLTNGSFYFIDLDWTNYPGRFYRLRSP
jgi:hypothetical protein